MSKDGTLPAPQKPTPNVSSFLTITFSNRYNHFPGSYSNHFLAFLKMVFFFISVCLLSLNIMTIRFIHRMHSFSLHVIFHSTNRKCSSWWHVVASVYHVSCAHAHRFLAGSASPTQEPFAMTQRACRWQGPTLRVSDAVGLGWNLRVYISNRFPSDADVAARSGDHTLRTTAFSYRKGFSGSRGMHLFSFTK